MVKWKLQGFEGWVLKADGMLTVGVLFAVFPLDGTE